MQAGILLASSHHLSLDHSGYGQLVGDGDAVVGAVVGAAVLGAVVVVAGDGVAGVESLNLKAFTKHLSDNEMLSKYVPYLI